MAQLSDEDFYDCLRDASNACLRARRYLVEAIDSAPDGADTKDLWNAMDAITLWADWISPPGETWPDNVVRFPIERRG